MTREEAKRILTGNVYEETRTGCRIVIYGHSSVSVDSALSMAIEALSRPQGEWIPHATSVGGKKYIEYSRCSECGEMALVRMNFCPNCGADMRGGE